MEPDTSVTDSVILTLYNRDAITLSATLRGLCKNDMSRTEIVMIDDGSDEVNAASYLDLVRYLRGQGLAVTFERMGPYDAYRINGHNNPARVNNRALELAKGERIFWLSSDVIIQPTALARARRFDPNEAVVVGQTVDMDTGAIFCGPNRLFPMMWFVATSKRACLDAGGFDEEYLKGMAFEDNDFMGRLAATVGSLVFDFEVLCFHQSHPNTAYSDDLEGFKKSSAYTLSKWHGVPFRGDKPVLKLKTAMHPKGLPMWKVELQSNDTPVAATLRQGSIA